MASKNIHKQELPDQVLTDLGFEEATQVGLMMNVPKNKLNEVMEILPKGKKPTIAELTDSNWMDLTVILEEKLVREIAPALKAIGVEDIVEYSINKIIQ